MSTVALSLYGEDFYDYVNNTARASAEVVVPLLMEMLFPESVVDVGCGEGMWLSLFSACGVQKIVGMDGDYVQRQRLLIPEDCFFPTDLTQTFDHSERFSLAISLEVAEHLPESSARMFVSSLVRLADVVLFSAAIPGQGGTNHLHEQWPEYWTSLFEEHGYHVVDAIRPLIWSNDSVAVWYRQNMLIFSNEKCLNESSPLRAAREQTRLGQLSVVHPELFTGHLARCRYPMAPEHFGLRQILPRLPGMVMRSLRKRLGR